MGPLDVAILGGGPVGLALAAPLARQGRAVAVFERAPRIPDKAGESFGPALRPTLERLGAWEAFQTLATVPFRGVRSAWGGEDLRIRDAIVHPLGEGWHVDRAAFEGMLEGVAREAGVRVLRGGGPCRALREGDGFRLQGGAGEGCRARVVVDASGRGALAAGLGLGGTWVSVDRQVGLLVDVRLPAGDALGPELLLEAAEQGWWYVVPQPSGHLRCVWLTDGDLLPPGGREVLRAAFQEALAGTRHTARLLSSAEIPSPRVIRADTGFLLPPRGSGWFAVGDAALGGDPLGGNGLERGLEGALEALPLILGALDGRAAGPAPDPWPRLATYLTTRARYYAMETRWADALFWRRRRAPALEAVPLWLSPVERLQVGEESPQARARAEAWVPRTMLEEVLKGVQGPTPAHDILAGLRTRAPLGDGRLLAALQALVEEGALRAAFPAPQPPA